MTRGKKERLDTLVSRRGLAESREQAQRLIRAGLVRSGDRILSKPGHLFDAEMSLDVERGPRFVSRGGEKLETAFESFGLDVRGLVCLDVGSSTGGFTDCMLQRGAARVIAVDVGRGQLHWKLRNDARVTILDKTNARYLAAEDVPARPEFAAIDVSFISLTKVMPAVASVLADGSALVTLVKPQFEAGRKFVGKGGVVRDADVRVAVVESIRVFGARELGLKCLGTAESPLRGPAGNVEFLIHWRKH